MTIAIADLGFSHTTAGSTSVTVSANCAIGDVVFVVANSDGTNSPAITDSGGNTWTLITSANLNGSSANGNSFLYYSVLTTALTSAVSTITNTTTGAGSTQLNCTKITGQATSSPLDTSVTASQTGTGASPSVTSGTPSQSSDLMIGVVSFRNSTTFTQDSGHGWAVPPQTGPVGTTGPTISIGAGSQINTGIGTKIFSPTIGAVAWAAFIVAFKSPVVTVLSQNIDMVSRRRRAVAY